MNKYETVKNLTNNNFRVLPISDGTKIPRYGCPIHKQLINSPFKAQDTDLILEQWKGKDLDVPNVAVVSGDNLFGSGVTVFDCDVKGIVDGNKLFLDKCEELNFDPISNALWVTKSPSGGYHYVYPYTSNINVGKQSPSGLSIDVLNGNNNYFLVPPSNINNVEYKYLKGMDFNASGIPEDIAIQLQDWIGSVKHDQYKSISQWITKSDGKKVMKKQPKGSGTPSIELVAQSIKKHKREYKSSGFYIDEFDAISKGLESLELKRWMFNYIIHKYQLKQYERYPKMNRNHWWKGVNKERWINQTRYRSNQYENHKDYWHELFLDKYPAFKGFYPFINQDDIDNLFKNNL